MSEHTLGPHIQETAISADGEPRKLIGIAAKGDGSFPFVAIVLDTVPREQQIANAALYAASEDLLAACEALTAKLSSFVALHPGQADASDHAAIEAGEAAIAKTERRV